MDKPLKEAIKYLSSLIEENQGFDMLHLIEDAAKKFNLNPLQCDFLIRKYLK